MKWDPRTQVKEVADRALQNRLGVRKELRKLPSLLHEGEEVRNMASGAYAAINGLIVLTDRRVMFIAEGVVRSVLEDFPLERISSVQHESGIMQGKLTIFASGNKAEITNVVPKQGARQVADAIRQHISSAGLQPPPIVSTSAVPAADDPIEKLRRLGELRDAGVLTDDEFQTQKARLLEQL